VNDDCPDSYTCEDSGAEPAEGADAGSSKVCKYEGSTGGGGGWNVVDGPPVAKTQLSSEYARVMCGRIFGCCDAQEQQEMLDDFGGAATEAECRTKLQQLFDGLTADMDASIDSGRVTYNANNAGDCVATIEAMDCSYGAFPEGEEGPAVCEETLVGQVEEGGECYSNDECSVGECLGQEYDENGDVSQPGTCSTGINIGEECDWSDDCVDGAYCAHEYDQDAGETVSTCKAIGDAGESCSDSQGCTEGLVCNREFDQETGEMVGTCAQPAAIGESCSGNGCVEGAFCETYDPETGETPNVCRALKGEGESCNYGQCDENTYCKASEGGSSGSFSGTCTAHIADGEPCEGSQECASGWCGSSGSDPNAASTCQPDSGGDGPACDGV
jgi:hypothetical protein